MRALFPSMDSLAFIIVDGELDYDIVVLFFNSGASSAVRDSPGCMGGDFNCVMDRI